MPFINGGHIWLILGLIVLLVIFGPGKLPELGTAVGKTIKAFKKSTEDLKAEMAHKDSEPAIEPIHAESARVEPAFANADRSQSLRNDPVLVKPAGGQPARSEVVRHETVPSEAMHAQAARYEG